MYRGDEWSSLWLARRDRLTGPRAYCIICHAQPTQHIELWSWGGETHRRRVTDRRLETRQEDWKSSCLRFCEIDGRKHYWR